MNETRIIRKAAVSGLFYPDDPQELKSEISRYIDNVVTDRTDKDIKAIVAPHAGYYYSGQVAAYAYRQLVDKQIDTVVVLSPSHRVVLHYCSVFDGDAYETPLGEITIDREVSAELSGFGNGTIRLSRDGHIKSEEHALEVHLPFLQAVLGDFNLVAVIMGVQDRHMVSVLGKALQKSLQGKNALIVASSDLSHFHDHLGAKNLDMQIVDAIDKFDPDSLLNIVESSHAEACGAGPIAASMVAARAMGAVCGENLYYSNSGEVSGDYHRVVGYTSGIFYS